jgi:hypothetical protein
MNQIGNKLDSARQLKTGLLPEDIE